MTHVRLGFALILLAMVPASAMAEEICSNVTEKKSVDAAKEVAIKAGYTDIAKMDEEDGCYEAKGTNADGSKFEVYIHPTTLEIVKVKKE